MEGDEDTISRSYMSTLRLKEARRHFQVTKQLGKPVMETQLSGFRAQMTHFCILLFLMVHISAENGC